MSADGTYLASRKEAIALSEKYFFDVTKHGEVAVLRAMEGALQLVADERHICDSQRDHCSELAVGIRRMLQ